MAKKQRCYIYTRVSTELQIDGYSLEAQKERLRSEAKHRKMQVCGEYSDEGKSGKNIAGRPEFKKMLSDINLARVMLIMCLSSSYRDLVVMLLTHLIHYSSWKTME